MQIRWCFISAVILLTACTKDYNFNLDNNKPLYVIAGRISDLQGPYYIHITKSTNLLGYPRTSDLIDTFEAVQAAQVTIADDMGMVDTLIPVVYSSPRWLYTYKNGILDSQVTDFPGTYINYKRGYYQTTKIRGMPGHSYHLDVRIGDSTFQASAYMPRVPDLDSAAIKSDTIVNAAGDKGHLPLVWFKEPPDEKNYYMLQFYSSIGEYPYDMFLFHSNKNNYSIPFVVDDKILPPYVNGLSVQLIIPDSYPYPGPGPYYNIRPNEPSLFRLSSLTKEAYNYFTVLRKQLQTDGNVYKPVPASASGNIKGGALGLFWASSISYKLILPK